MTNQKIIKNFKSRDVSTRRQLHEFVKAMCNEGKGDEMENILLDKGMSPCKAREWGNQHIYRANLLKRNINRKYRKETSAFGRQRTNYRRIISSTICDGRVIEFHATKGTRSYQVTV